jgi:hypothetical protein
MLMAAVPARASAETRQEVLSGTLTVMAPIVVRAWIMAGVAANAALMPPAPVVRLTEAPARPVAEMGPGRHAAGQSREPDCPGPGCHLDGRGPRHPDLVGDAADKLGPAVRYLGS